MEAFVIVMVPIGIAVHLLFVFSLWRYRRNARRGGGTSARSDLTAISGILVTLFWVAFVMHYWAQ